MFPPFGADPELFEQERGDQPICLQLVGALAEIVPFVLEHVVVYIADVAAVGREGEVVEEVGPAEGEELLEARGCGCPRCHAIPAYLHPDQEIGQSA